MKNSMLIPSIADREGWRRYFRVNILRALGYCQKILNLYNRISTDTFNPMIKKMVMGVIGRDTVGYWRDIQDIYMKFFGIKCIKCREAVKKIAIGIPFDNVVDEISLSIAPRSKLLDDVKMLSFILNNIVSKTVGVEEVVRSSDNEIEMLVKSLSSNPLEVIRFIKGFYSIIISLLPLYNEYTYFLYITKAIPASLLSKFFSGLDLNELNKYNIYYDKICVCRNDGNGVLLTHNSNSVANYVNMCIDSIYQYIKRSLKLNLSKFFNIVDEEERYISTMVEEVKKIERRINTASLAVLKIIERNSIMYKSKTNYVCSDTNILFYRNKCQVIIGSANLVYNEFIENLTPYFLTGLIHIKDIQEKESGVVKARLRICYSIKE